MKLTAGWTELNGWKVYEGNRPDGWKPGPWTVTRKDVGMFDPRKLLEIPGANHEERHFLEISPNKFRSDKYPGTEWIDFVDWVRIDLANPDSQNRVMIIKKDEPKIWEGNHRIRAAVEAGLSLIPVEFVYYSFSEDSGLIFNPETGKFSKWGYA